MGLRSEALKLVDWALGGLHRLFYWPSSLLPSSICTGPVGVSDIIFSRYANGSPAQQALTNTVYLLLEHLAILTGTDPEKGKELKADFDAEKAKEDEQEKGMQWY